MNYILHTIYITHAYVYGIKPNGYELSLVSFPFFVFILFCVPWDQKSYVVFWLKHPAV